MLFNSIEFLLLYLPLVLAGFFVVGRYSHRAAITWLFLASLYFYAHWNTTYLSLLLGSIGVNYLFGTGLTAMRRSNRSQKWRDALLFVAVGSNLLLLGYYKYAGFFAGIAASVTGMAAPDLQILLPLGISFFSFTQIAYLVDTARGISSEPNLVRYGLFVTWFPHLIAGPVLHHKEMMPQFARPDLCKPHWECIAVGLTMFALGLFKKVVLADQLAPHVGDVFGAAEAGKTIDLVQAWSGALSYTLQLYFDFSGYCDMAIGLSYLFGVKLPTNFNSPYKAVNIAEFWRRWHMTLSRFLRDYLYIPLGGNRNGKNRRLINLFLTMLLGGLWHGAGWTFVVWGGLHGLYLIMHQGWQATGFHRRAPWWLRQRWLSCALTFLAVVIGWVVFRAQSMTGALGVLGGMVGAHGLVLPAALAGPLGPLAQPLTDAGVVFSGGGGRELVRNWAWILALLPVVFLAPNTQQIMARFQPTLETAAHWRGGRLQWRPSMRWALLSSAVLALGLLSLTQPSEFLYFQF